MDNKMTWGYHLSVNASGCKHETIIDRQTIHDFTKKLVKEIDMVAYGQPEIVNFGEGDKAGYTMQQLISTSNICAHFANDLDATFLDVFSCKTFDKKVVVKLIKKYFHAKKITTKFQKRNCYTINK